MVSPVSLLEGHKRVTCPVCDTLLDYTDEDVFIRLVKGENGMLFTDAVQCCCCTTHILLEPLKGE